MTRLLIASPNNNSFSETFIRNQTSGLNPDFLLIGGWYPYLLNGKTIFRGLLKINTIRGIVRKISKQKYESLYVKSLVYSINSNNITHALIHYGPTAVHLLKALNISGCNFTVHFHGFDAFHHITLNKYKTAYQNVFQNANKIVSVSGDMYNQLLSIGANPEKLFLQPYGVDINFFIPSGRKINSVKNLLFVGRLTPKKSPFDLLKAFQISLQKHPDLNLKIVGDGELKKEVQQFIKTRNLEESVQLAGILNTEEVRNEMILCDLFVQHSVRASHGDSEGTPNTIIEAASCGKAIVSTFHAGIKEAVIHKETGLLVEEGDFEKMAEYINYLVENPEICNKMGESGRVHILKHYNFENSIKSLKNIIFS